jgi:broad specificity phosphatase PhoE
MNATEPLFYFVRHGETDWNAEQRLQGQRDVPLNIRGRHQAAHCGGVIERLITRNSRRIEEFTFISSPLMRARETMEIMRDALGMVRQEFATDDRLVELSFGQWEGLTYRDVRARDPGALRWRERDKWNFKPPEGESYAQLLVRVRQWHAGLSGDVIVAAHGGVARVLMVLFGVRPPAEAPLGSVNQGVVYQFAPGSMDCYGE